MGNVNYPTVHPRNFHPSSEPRELSTCDLNLFFKEVKRRDVVLWGNPDSIFAKSFSAGGITLSLAFTVSGVILRVCLFLGHIPPLLGYDKGPHLSIILYEGRSFKLFSSRPGSDQSFVIVFVSFTGLISECVLPMALLGLVLLLPAQFSLIQRFSALWVAGFVFLGCLQIVRVAYLHKHAF